MTIAESDLLQDTLSECGSIIAGVSTDQSSLPTPCTEFTVEQLVSHLVGWAISFAGRLTGEPSDADPNAYQAGVHPDAEFDRAARVIVQAYLSDLAPTREMPVGFLLMEYVTHGWDLATATGQAVHFSEEAADSGLAVGRSMLKPEYRGPGQAFGEEVHTSHDDNAVERLVAFLGRDPHWAP